MSGLGSPSEKPGRETSTPKQTGRESAARARSIADDMRVRDGAQPEFPASELEPLFEHFTNPNTGESVIIPVARTRTPCGGVTCSRMPPIPQGQIRPSAPAKRPCPAGASIGTAAASGRSGLVWAGHLERCVDRSGYVYFVPVVYVIEEAKAPNNLPVIK